MCGGVLCAGCLAQLVCCFAVMRQFCVWWLVVRRLCLTERLCVVRYRIYAWPVSGLLGQSAVTEKLLAGIGKLLAALLKCRASTACD
jgi:hypothetical protein